MANPFLVCRPLGAETPLSETRMTKPSVGLVPKRKAEPGSERERGPSGGDYAPCAVS